MQLLPNIPNELIYDLCEEEVKDVAVEKISIGMQYIDVARAKEPTVCDCHEVKVLQERLLQLRDGFAIVVLQTAFIRDAVTLPLLNLYHNLHLASNLVAASTAMDIPSVKLIDTASHAFLSSSNSTSIKVGL